MIGPINKSAFACPFDELFPFEGKTSANYAEREKEKQEEEDEWKDHSEPKLSISFSHSMGLHIYLHLVAINEWNENETRSLEFIVHGMRQMARSECLN